MSSIVLGIASGYFVSWVLGLVNFSAVDTYGGLNVPVPFKYGIDFDSLQSLL